MFSSFMTGTWTVATIVAVVAGVAGFFVVLRGSAFVADALPTGAFAGAAGATLIGVSTLLGLTVFSLLGAVSIGLLGRRSRHDVATALTLVLMLGLGALFLSFSTEYAPEIYSLLFGEVLGISAQEVGPTAALAAVCVLAILVMFRPLMLSSLAPESGEARGVRSHLIEIAFLLVIALVTSMALPVVGALLIFSLMIGPPAAARAFTDNPYLAMALSAVVAVVTVWVSIAAAYPSNWPIGFFVGAISAFWYAVGRGWSAWRRTRPARGAANRDEGAPAVAC